MDDVFVSKDHQRLITFASIFIGIFFVNFFVRFLHTYLIRLTIGQVNQAIKLDLFQHLIHLSADHHLKNSTGSLLSRIGTDPSAIDQGITASTVLIREPATFLILLGYTIHLNWKLTLITFLILPPLSWVFVRANRNLRRYAGAMAEHNALMFSTIQEAFSGIRIIKAFGLEDLLCMKYFDRSESWKRTYFKTAKLEEAAPPTVELLTSFAVAAVILIGGSDVVSGMMSPGDFLGFFTAFGMMIHPLRLLNDINVKLAAASTATDRIFEVLSWRTSIIEKPDPLAKDQLTSEVRFRQVSFSYPDSPQTPILENINFSIPKGATYALVGGSGAGKSSITHLLARVYDPTLGSIEIDDIDLRNIRLTSIRNLISIVSQDVFLFNDTIEENIRMGRPEASKEEIRAAARAAFAEDFILRTPEGYQTIIGDRGQRLSGGERQRISIARAFLRHAPILILDEATSALDNESEKAVQKALQDLMKDRTTLVIAHRLSTIQDADQILVMKQGKIIETGKHECLLDLEGEYAKLVRLTQS